MKRSNNSYKLDQKRSAGADKIAAWIAGVCLCGLFTG